MRVKALGAGHGHDMPDENTPPTPAPTVDEIPSDGDSHDSLSHAERPSTESRGGSEDAPLTTDPEAQDGDSLVNPSGD